MAPKASIVAAHLALLEQGRELLEGLPARG